MKHTPTPLYANDEYIQAANEDEENYVCKIEADTATEARAIALEMVQAVNSHDALVESLRMMYAFADGVQSAFDNHNLKVPYCEGKADAFLLLTKLAKGE